MKREAVKSGSNICFSIIFCVFLSLVILPCLAIASEGSAQFFVSAWLVRVWLALVSGATIIAGVLVALDSHTKDHRLEPTLTPDAGVTISRVREISYRKISGGLLLVVFGCLFFVTSVFLLPDKRTGHSGISKIVDHFRADQSSETLAVTNNIKSSSKH